MIVSNVPQIVARLLVQCDSRRTAKNSCIRRIASAARTPITSGRWVSLRSRTTSRSDPSGPGFRFPRAEHGPVDRDSVIAPAHIVHGSTVTTGVRGQPPSVTERSRGCPQAGPRHCAVGSESASRRLAARASSTVRVVDDRTDRRRRRHPARCRVEGGTHHRLHGRAAVSGRESGQRPSVSGIAGQLLSETEAGGDHADLFVGVQIGVADDHRQHRVGSPRSASTPRSPSSHGSTSSMSSGSRSGTSRLRASGTSTAMS